MNTDTKWLVYLQDLTELAYFRGDIRRCRYEISFLNEDGELVTTYAAIRGPVETKINFIQKSGISVDQPNHSLNILMPKNEHTLAYFKRYSKFYLLSSHEEFPEEYRVCWRVEATDWVSMPGVFEITAVEYYANDDEDDIANGIAGALIVEEENPNDEGIEVLISGPTFIKPRAFYEYTFAAKNWGNKWSVGPEGVPVTLEADDQSPGVCRVRWDSSYSGEFELRYGLNVKKIVVQSLF
jgi:hypothetical protein